MSNKMRFYPFVLAALLVIPSAALAATLEVGWPSSWETKKLKMEEDDLGDIRVFLASAGDMLNNFKILLVDDKNKRLLRVQKTGLDGIVVFKGVKPGVYTVLVRLNKKERRRRSVKVGDVKLSFSDKLDAIGTGDDPKDEIKGSEIESVGETKTDE